MRLKLWFFFAIGLIVFAGVLMALNPAIAAAPVGFVVIFLTCLAPALLIDWVAAWIRVPVVPLLMRAFAVLTIWAVFMSTGSAPAGVASFFLMIAIFVYTTVAARRRRIALEQREFENHSRQIYTMEGGGMVRAARGIPGTPWRPTKR
jgi:hypothetical protein